MKRYQIQALDGWNKLKLNETLEFVVKGTSRTIRVELIQATKWLCMDQTQKISKMKNF